MAITASRDAAQRDGEPRLVALAGGSRRLLALERALELGRRPGALRLPPRRARAAAARGSRAASRSPFGEIVELLDRAPGAPTGSPRASARAASTAPICARTTRRLTSSASVRPPPRMVDGDRVTSTPSDHQNLPIDRRATAARAPIVHAGDRRRCARPSRSACLRAVSIAPTPRARCESPRRTPASACRRCTSLRARVRAMIVSSESSSASTPSGGACCCCRTLLNSRGEHAGAEHESQAAVARHRHADRDEGRTRRRIACAAADTAGLLSRTDAAHPVVADQLDGVPNGTAVSTSTVDPTGSTSRIECQPVPLRSQLGRDVVERAADRWASIGSSSEMIVSCATVLWTS